MNEKENDCIIVIEDEKGKKKECEILFTFTPKEGDKKYVVYTSDELDEDDCKKVYANIYYDNNKKELLPIESEEEWYTVEAVLAKLIEKSKEV